MTPGVRTSLIRVTRRQSFRTELWTSRQRAALQPTQAGTPPHPCPRGPAGAQPRGIHAQTPGAGPGPGGPIRGRAGPPDFKACPYRCLCLACPPSAVVGGHHICFLVCKMGGVSLPSQQHCWEDPTVCVRWGPESAPGRCWLLPRTPEPSCPPIPSPCPQDPRSRNSPALGST